MSKNTFGGINGTQVNKVGSVVGYKFRGEQVYRGYQKKVANPRTTAQMLNRARFGSLSSFLREVSVPINWGYEKVAKGTKWSPRNFAYRTNYPVVFPGSTDEVDLTRVIMSKGNLLNPQLGEADFSTARNVRIPITSSPYAAATNALIDFVIVVYAPELKEVVVGTSNLATDVQGLSANVSVPASFTGQTVLVWAFIRARQSDIEDPTYGLIEKLSVSDSVFLDAGEIS